MQHWLDILQQDLKQHDRVVLVTVAYIRGSTPREAGAHMVVSANGISGTIGGGNLEFKAIDQARELLRDNDHAVLYQDYPLGPALGQCCGGVASLIFETVTSDMSWVSDNATEGFVSVLALNGSMGRIVYAPDQQQVDVLIPASVKKQIVEMTETTLLLENEGYFIEKVTDYRIPLYIYGAGHVAHALVPMLAQLPFNITWVDNRADIFKSATGGVETLIVSRPEEVPKIAKNNAFHLVMTHDHGIDLEITHAVLQEDRFGYLGLIGSDTKRVRFERRLRARGIDHDHLDRMICPIGIPEITGKSPGEVALSVAAELTILHQEMVANTKNLSGLRLMEGIGREKHEQCR
ncbi:MAG: xanthine dehydrogenase accessory protein XdhC [Alphaproteobacteria bacterium]|nr:xanthine dehydrogenase accessory protein XdhC [Alphaproteobacteria bacterium]